MSVDVGQRLERCADNLVRAQRFLLQPHRVQKEERKGEEGRGDEAAGGKGGKNDLAGNNNSNP